MNLSRPDSPSLPRRCTTLILVVIRVAVTRNAQLRWCMGQKLQIGMWHIRIKWRPDLESLPYESQSGQNDFCASSRVVLRVCLYSSSKQVKSGRSLVVQRPVFTSFTPQDQQPHCTAEIYALK